MAHSMTGAGEPGASRFALLARAAQALHGERDLDQVVAWAVDATASVVGGHEVAVCLLPRDGSPTWTQHGRATVNFKLLADPRTSAVVRSGLRPGEHVAISEIGDAGQVRADDRLRRVLNTGRLLVAPVASSDHDAVLGAIFVADLEPGSFDRDTIEAVGALAAHLAVALANHARIVHLAEVEARGKEVVYQLQEAVRPPAPIVPSTELGVHYVAADPSAPTGGDLYDWSLLPDGDLHLTVVDVMGKGVQATKHALDVTHTLRYLALAGCPLEVMVARAGELIGSQNPDVVATLLVARYSPETGRLRLAGGGHPPALVISNHKVREINAPGIPIGWPGAGSQEVVELTLERSDTLILYTDGLIEAGKNILRGLDDLTAAAAATASYPANAMARVLVERQLADATRQDDSLAMVLRRRTPPRSLDRHLLAPFHHQFTPNPAAVPLARHLFRDWLERVPVDGEATDNLLLVASELLSNAVRHASGAPAGVVMRAWVEGDAVVLEVEDDGGTLAWPERIGPDLPDPDAERGRGLFLVQELSDEVTGTNDGGRTLVKVTKRAVVAPPDVVEAGAAGL